MYHVHSVNELTQIIGYVKYKNVLYGNVLYRGQCKLYDSLEPSIYHNHTGKQDRVNQNCKLNGILKKALSDDKFCQYAHLSDSSISRIKLMSILQHYGIPTQYLDVVDNHWTALWFGLNESKTYANGDVFCKYEQRHIDLLDAVRARKEYNDEEYMDYSERFYQYIILILVANPTQQSSNEVIIGEDTIAVNLRNALPSTFLRPHAQHGWTIRRKSTDGIYGLDLSPNVVCILRMRIDDVEKWIGTGTLLSEAGLFPSPKDDFGYGVLLKHREFFNGTGWEIPYYV